MRLRLVPIGLAAVRRYYVREVITHGLRSVYRDGGHLGVAWVSPQHSIEPLLHLTPVRLRQAEQLADHAHSERPTEVGSEIGASIVDSVPQERRGYPLDGSLEQVHLLRHEVLTQY